jgi:hypothetical protein
VDTGDFGTNARHPPRKRFPSQQRQHVRADTTVRPYADISIFRPFCNDYFTAFTGTCTTLTENGGSVTFIRLPVIGNVVSRGTSLVGFSSELSSLSALA